MNTKAAAAILAGIFSTAPLPAAAQDGAEDTHQTLRTDIDALASAVGDLRGSVESLRAERRAEMERFESLLTAARQVGESEASPAVEQIAVDIRALVYVQSTAVVVIIVLAIFGARRWFDWCAAIMNTLKRLNGNGDNPMATDAESRTRPEIR